MCDPKIHIQARGLTRCFGERTAVDRIDLDIERGHIFGLLGANGAGKTTFIRLITGFLLPTSGSLRVGGISPAEDPKSVQRRLGFVAESSQLYPELRVERFLAFMAGIRGLGSASARRAVDRTLDRFGLGDSRRRLIGNLSKGLQQRVSLAQAFLHEPELLVVDEPTSGLDPLQRAEVRQILVDLQGQCTVLLCSHDLAEVRELAARIAVLSQGRLVAEGSPQELLTGDNPLGLFRGEPPETSP